MSHLWGKSMFAPVGRGAPGHPDRGRQRHGRQEDGPFAGAQPVRHQQGDQAQHVVPVQRERVLTAVPAEASEDGPLLHRRPRAAQGRPQARQTTQAPPPVMRTPVVAGGGAGVAAGGRRVSRFPDGFPSPSVRRRPARVAVTCDDGAGFARRTRLRDGPGMDTLLRRPILQPAAGRRREQERHDPPVSARTRRDSDGHGRGTAGIAGSTAVLHL